MIRTPVQGTAAALPSTRRGAKGRPGEIEQEEAVDMHKRYAVFSIRKGKGGSVWTRAGSAFLNKDGSVNLYLDVLPLDGMLHIREAGEKRDLVQEPKTETLTQSEFAQQATEGH
jgi:hypothetical protein